MEFVGTQKGKKALFYEGYKYICHRTNKEGSVAWRCQRYWSHTCKATAYTWTSRELPELRGEHTHAPDPTAASVEKVKENMRARIREQPHLSAPEIYNQEVASMTNRVTDPEVLSDLPSFVSFKSSLYREKLKVHRTYKTTAGKATLDGNYTETVDGRDFLALDVESPQGSIICFATEEGLSRLSSAQELLFDGAASTCPSAGSVYLTTSVAVKGENVIVGYFLLPGGTKTIYASALSELLNCIEELSLPRPNPSYVRSDFDPALVQALGQVFPAAKHRGCHFQFAQEVWRYVQRLGLAKHYNDDKAVREFVKKTVALAFLPSSFVHVSWRQLKDEVSAVDTLEGFVDYFETTWILGDYDVSQWNQHGNRGCLTSHRKELLHRKMSQVIGASRPDILKFAVVAKQDEADTRAAISELGSGTPQRKGGKKVDKTESDLERYEEGLATGQLTIAEFLRACSRMCGI